MTEIFFQKMSGAGNDFVIIDARKTSQNDEISFSSGQILKISNRKNIGCDQFVLIKDSQNADCLMEIYNSDGSKSSTCGNATRCVAALIAEEKNINELKIETSSQILNCKKNGDEISVEMGKIKFFETNFYFNDLKFFLADVGNPHAVCFLDDMLIDEDFFEIGKSVESHKFFPNKTNVEFAKIIAKNIIEVRVFERGAGETLACGSGACAVAALAIKNNFVEENKVIVRFKGGDLTIIFNKETSEVTMVGGYQKIFAGKIDESFL